MTYGTLIKVIAGFYVGCVGVVHKQINYAYDTRFNMELHCKVGEDNGQIDILMADLHYDDVKVIKKPEWCNILLHHDYICK